MIDVRFYLEYENKTEKNKATRKNLGKHTGNVIAIFPNTIQVWNEFQTQFDGIGALNYGSNSQVCSTNTSQGYLSENCKYISEALARTIHPNLFAYLDN